METLTENDKAPSGPEPGDAVSLRRSDRGAMSGGGTVSFEVRLGRRWIGWIGDERQWKGHDYGGRRWWAVWREDGDTAARWNSFSSDGGGFRTRTGARDALVAQVRAGDAR